MKTQISHYFKYAGLLLCGTFLLFSCSKEDGPENEPDEKEQQYQTDIYVAGYESEEGVNIAKYWKNGEPVSLTDGNLNAEAFSIHVDGGDVYVSGHETEGERLPYTLVAKYWKNGNPVSLSNGDYDATAVSIAVNGDDIHLAGYEKEGYSSRNVPKYWRNGAASILPYEEYGLRGSAAYSVILDGNNVFIAGSVGNDSWNSVATYWKNGTPVFLTDGNSADRAIAIAINEDNIYVAGHEERGGNYNARYWKDGTAVFLTDGSRHSAVSDMALDGDDVHVVGYEMNSTGTKRVAKYWKNDTGVALTDGLFDAEANAIAVDGADVYVAGYENISLGRRIAKYWKNGTAVPISGGENRATAHDIFIVKTPVE